MLGDYRAVRFVLYKSKLFRDDTNGDDFFGIWFTNSLFRCISIIVNECSHSHNSQQWRTTPMKLDPTRRLEGYCIPKKYFLLSKDMRDRQAVLLHERANNVLGSK